MSKVSIQADMSEQKTQKPLKLSANLSWLFGEWATVPERMRAARDAGFEAVEAGLYPDYNQDVHMLAQARKEFGLKHVLINSYPGDGSDGLMKIGHGVEPDHVQGFREKLGLTVQYAKALDCQIVHVLAGRVPATCDETKMKQLEDTYLSNLRYAADTFQAEGIVAVIEAISIPDYFLTQPSKALEIVKKVNHPNLKILYDVEHVQKMEGNFTHSLKEQLPYISHIQIAQVPDGGEPDTKGEINFPYFFHLLRELGYDGYVGCEYTPRGTTLEGLKWMQELEQ